jgi:hypothetical protein
LEAGFSVLEIPSSEWKQIVFEFIQIASVIVVDTNAGIFHWMGDLPAKVLECRAAALIAERRIGFLEELQEIVAKGFVNETVAVVPPRWEN